MLRCNKGSTWEGGIREPFIVRWPGRVPPHSRRLQPVSLMDLFATALAVAAETPGATATLERHGNGAAVDGKDLRAVLASAAAPSPHNALFHVVRSKTPPK